jgi:TolB-like protein/Tfp pilus assembly protein PilF
MIGKSISHYTIQRKLGEGGMGVVYAAQDTKLDREVALKFLPLNLAASDEDLSRFEQEAKAISALNHPSIATIYDIDDAGGQKYLVLEYIPGGTLKTKLRELKSQGNSLSIEDAVDLSVQICEGLTHAHNHGITHRDLKSDNIMFSEEGRAKLSDFGLAKLREGKQITKTGSALGTAGYASPEQIRGEDADHRSDIFSFGVVLYEMLTTELPFKGDFEAALTYAILNEPPVPAGSHRSDIPVTLEKVVNRCMEKDRTRRYQKTEDLLADLRRIQEEMRAEPTPRARRIPTVWIGAGVAAGLALIVSILWLSLREGTPQAEKSIAVLPFRNLSDDKEDEYFADGLTEDIITRVSKVRGIGKVIARTSVMQYKGVDRSVREIGRELAVATVLEGSVRRAGDRIRIVAQLINVEDEDHLWAETYDKELTQIFEIQTSVAEEIANALQAQYSARDPDRPPSSVTDNSLAYELYLKGRHFWNKRTAEDLGKAIRYFNQAIDEDPLYAPAYGGLAISYAIQTGYTDIPASEAVPQAQAAASRALQLDESLAEPHAALGFVAYWYADNWDEAEHQLKTALELNPNYLTAHHWYSHYLSYRGRPDDALRHIQRAMELDPLTRRLIDCQGRIYYLARRYDEAIASLQRVLAYDSTLVGPHGVLADVYVAKGLYDNAFVHWRKEGWEDVDEWWDAYQEGGERGLWQKRLELTLKASEDQDPYPGYIARLYSHLGMADEAFEWLEKAQSESLLPRSLRVDPHFDNIRSDPRFSLLVKSMGIAEEEQVK